TKVAHGMGGEDIVVQYFNEADESIFKVSRLALSKPAPLVTDRDAKGNVVPGKLARQGILDLTADQIKMDMGGAEILRQDTIKLADGDAGVI
ncbi:hypothetical protein, partial [Salmonella sp. SAL4443]|uniref:hypothetical protein n=1 Tax=Salmonella sp. SAL4443 TaxID=3159898 RepID=UPI003978C5E1